MDSWLIINALGFVGAPAGLVDGWIAYRNLATRRGGRARASLLALICASLDATMLVAALCTSRAFAIQSTNEVGLLVVRFGIYLALGGAALSLAGKPRLILPALFANVGMIALWFGLTVP